MLGNADPEREPRGECRIVLRHLHNDGGTTSEYLVGTPTTNPSMVIQTGVGSQLKKGEQMGAATLDINDFLACGYAKRYLLGCESRDGYPSLGRRHPRALPEGPSLCRQGEEHAL